MPLIVLFRRTTILPEMLELKGLVLKPRLMDGRIVSMSSNVADFLKKNEKIKNTNLLVGILQAMCNDADKGICHSANLYLTDFRASLRKFMLWVLLGSHIPFFVLLFYKHAPFTELIKYQLCCYVLMYLLEMALQYRYIGFTKVFYTHWYDKIMNFDLLLVSMIRSDVKNIKNLCNSQVLQETVEKFAESNSSLANGLLTHTVMLSARLEDFLNVQQKTNGISAQTVVMSLDDCIKRFTEVHENLRQINAGFEQAFDTLTKINKSNKNEINAINKNAEMLFDLRENFKTYKSEAVSAEITQLQKTAGLLENNVGSAFAAISNAMSQNFTRLEAGYDEFFDMCKNMSETMLSNYEEKSASLLTSLSDSLVGEFAVIKERMEKLASAIEGTSEATKIICETFFDFTQYNKAPDFMDKITKFVKFSGKLKDAADKLIVYEKLAALGLAEDRSEEANSKNGNAADDEAGKE
jgi:hypothetical protein